MVKSPEYIDYSSEVDRFVSDMNYSGDNMNFKTNDDLLIGLKTILLKQTLVVLNLQRKGILKLKTSFLLFTNKIQRISQR
jgi:hypothetical protein